MAKRDEVTSTERLLDLIRTDSESDYNAATAGSNKSLGHRLKNIFNNPVSFRKVVTVGIDLGHEDIKMVKISRVSSQKYEMLEYERIPFEDNIQFFEISQGNSPSNFIKCNMALCTNRLFSQ